VWLTCIHGHICIISPHQRGELNISHPGDPSCYRKQKPCGNVPPEQPVVTMHGGSQYTVQWQQNLNHYEPGYPGFMDIAYSTNSSATEDEQFFVLAVIPDFNAHMQLNQRNFSYTITVPNIQCAQCVLRMRYAPNKPTESIFYQCSDFAIVSSNSNSNVLYGVYYPEIPGQLSYLVSVDAVAGQVSDLAPFLFDIRRDGFPFIADQVCTRSVETNEIFYVASSSGIIGSVPDTLVIMNTNTFTSTFLSLSPILHPLVAINYDSTLERIIGLQLVDLGSGFWEFRVVNVDVVSGDVTYKFSLPKDDTYVNFQWTTFDSKRGYLFLLAGNENDPFALSAKVFTIDTVGNVLVNTASVDVSRFTIAGIHFDPIQNQLLALSPGLVGTTSPWFLVVVDPKKGSVSQKAIVANAGAYVPFYGGDVYGFNYASRLLYYIFFDSSNHNSGFIATINVDTGATSFSSKIPQLNQIHNLAYM